ncbi:MAG TPA: hypothetical protein VF331_21130, partial [Polyangiales bacterium]
MSLIPLVLAAAATLACGCTSSTRDTRGLGQDAGPPRGDAGGDAALDCVAPLGCGSADCAPYKPLDLNLVCSRHELKTALEGTCGAYRFQSAYALGGYASYWSIATGELVANDVFS